MPFLWTDVDPNDLLPGDPWTSGKAQAAFENVEALAAGADGAPRVQAVALGGLALSAVNSAAFAGWSDLDDVAELYLSGWYVAGVTAGVIEVRFSIDNGVNWGSVQTLMTTPSETSGSATIAINLVTGQYSAARFGAAPVNDTVTVPADVNSMQVRAAPSSSFLALITGGRD